MNRHWISYCIGFCLLFFEACTPNHRPVFMQKSAVQLSSPSVQVDSILFYQQAIIQLGPVQEGVDVYYSNADTALNLAQPIPDNPLVVHQSSKLHFGSKGDDFQPSEWIEINVFKIKAIEININSNSEAKAPYNQSPLSVLVDRHKAGKNFRSGEWLGFQETQVNIELQCKDVSLRELVLSCLEDQGSWIFAPTAIQADFYDANDQLISTQQHEFSADAQHEGSIFRFLSLVAPEQRISKISLSIQNLKTIPDWHPGSGHQPWLFIDEIILH